MSCIVPDSELADKNVFWELGFFTNGNVQGYSFRPQKKYKPTKQAFCYTRKLNRIVWNCGGLDYSELANTLHRALKGEYFIKRTAKSKILGNLLNKEVENMENHDCAKPHFIVQSVKQNCLVTG